VYDTPSMEARAPRVLAVARAALTRACCLVPAFVSGESWRWLQGARAAASRPAAHRRAAALAARAGGHACGSGAAARARGRRQQLRLPLRLRPGPLVGPADGAGLHGAPGAAARVEAALLARGQRRRQKRQQSYRRRHVPRAGRLARAQARPRPCRGAPHRGIRVRQAILRRDTASSDNAAG
jgi:hypothetical protein